MEQSAEFVYDTFGHLVQLSRAAEPVCPKCGEKVRWCLDMFSLTTGAEDPPFAVAHARCVWSGPAFLDEAVLADEITLAQEKEDRR